MSNDFGLPMNSCINNEKTLKAYTMLEKFSYINNNQLLECWDRSDHITNNNIHKYAYEFDNCKDIYLLYRRHQHYSVWTDALQHLDELIYGFKRYLKLFENYLELRIKYNKDSTNAKIFYDTFKL
jgi:hypothetical protein